MERFTVFNSNKTAIGTQYGMIQSVIDDCRLGEVIDRLGEYEDTGIPPEEIEQLMKTCHTAVELWTNTASKFCKMHDEIEYWKAQSILDKSNLGILRYYFEKHGTTLEQVLEDCKTMFPK